MKRYRAFFILSEAVLFILLGWQIFSSETTIVFFVLSILSLVWGLKIRQRKNKSTFATLLITFGVISLLVSLFTNFYIWLMIFIAIVWTVLEITHNSNETQNPIHFNRFPWQKKEFIQVMVEEPTPKNGKKEQHSWFGNTTIGNSVFEWDDINMSCISGDTIIDLGNTILPKANNVIIVSKGMGKTRILVPVGTSLSIESSALYGAISYDNQQYSLRNETVKIFSDDYDAATRKLKIVSNVGVGNLEVIYV